MVCALGPPIALKVEQRKTTELQEYGLITLRNYNTVSEQDGGWIFSAGPHFFRGGGGCRRHLNLQRPDLIPEAAAGDKKPLGRRAKMLIGASAPRIRRLRRRSFKVIC